MKIGIFDSGIGGLTVLKGALELLPQEDYIYFADTGHAPYGIKPKEEVKAYIYQAADFIAGKGVKALVVACNTATSVAIGDLRDRFDFPVIGMEPAVKPAVERNGGKRVLVAATPLTLKEDKFQDLVEKVDVENMVDVLPLPELVEYAERFVFDDQVVIPYLKEKLAEYDTGLYGTVVLGCTHFPFFKEQFARVFEEGTGIIDGSGGTVKRLKNVLAERGLGRAQGGTGGIEFYSSIGDRAESGRFMKYLSRL